MSRPAVISQHIIELLAENHQLSAPQIVEYLHANGEKVNKTSVYRALEKLSTDGILCKEMMTTETPVFELRDHHHDHLVCEKCGQVKNIGCVTKLPETIEDFTVDHHHTTVFGLCADCKEKSSIKKTVLQEFVSDTAD